MEDHAQSHIDLLFSSWPLICCLASNTGVGDLISISRTNSNFRSVLHGFPEHNLDNGSDQNPFPDQNTVRRSIRIGRHQTRQWANLKKSARYECASASHTKGENVHPCKYCSMPICEACIVRSSFANPNENTFKNRQRYLCPTCWKTGMLRKDHRFPADHVSREQIWRGRNYSQRGSFCTCTSKTDGWLCLPCKDSQNSVAYWNGVPHKDQRVEKGKSTERKPIECYGANCHNVIAEDDRDRRRICLWCAKPLPRQYGGEDRLRWDNKLIEARAINAASRSADIEEWARNRFRTLTMSRREMRGTVECIALTGFDSDDHDRPLFVRHLDAVNYRAALPETAVPDPEEVWKSKNGHWKYKRDFLVAVWRRTIRSKQTFSHTDAETLQSITRQDGLQFARTNRAIMKDRHKGRSNAERITHQRTGESVKEWTDLKAHLLQYNLVEGWSATLLQTLLREQYDIVINEKLLDQILQEWRKPKTKASPSESSNQASSSNHDNQEDTDLGPEDVELDDMEASSNDEDVAMEVDTEQAADTVEVPDASQHPEDVHDTESAMLEHALQESLIASANGQTLPRPQEEPPDYSP